jgi:hypothetical protein
VPDSSSLLLSPFVSLLALGLIVVICRWVFSTRRRDQLTALPPVTEDLGLLVPVAQVRTRDDAQMLREVLTDAGVRSGLSEGVDGVRVLVFRKDVDVARQLVSSS